MISPRLRRNAVLIGVLLVQWILLAEICVEGFVQLASPTIGYAIYSSMYVFAASPLWAAWSALGPQRAIIRLPRGVLLLAIGCLLPARVAELIWGKDFEGVMAFDGAWLMTFMFLAFLVLFLALRVCYGWRLVTIEQIQACAGQPAKRLSVRELLWQTACWAVVFQLLRVMTALPSFYRWLPEESLSVTLAALTLSAVGVVISSVGFVLGRDERRGFCLALAAFMIVQDIIAIRALRVPGAFQWSTLVTVDSIYGECLFVAALILPLLAVRAVGYRLVRRRDPPRMADTAGKSVTMKPAEDDTHARRVVEPGTGI